MATGHTITVTPANVHVEVTLGGEKLAESDRPVLLDETGYPTRYYLPREDVRTELLTPESTQYAVSSIQDYAERTEQTVASWKSMNGLQSGDPAKLAGALVQLASQDEPPLRFAAGADAVAAFEHKARDLLAQAGAYRELSSSLAYDDA